jgi:hypothetical protein
MAKRKRLVTETLVAGQYGVKLYQKPDRSFEVEYGEDVTKGLTEDEAGKLYGRCVMHSLRCASVLDGEPESKSKGVLVLIDRHGESWPKFITRDRSLAARWVAHDAPYRSAVDFKVDDAYLLNRVVEEENERMKR